MTTIKPGTARAGVKVGPSTRTVWGQRGLLGLQGVSAGEIRLILERARELSPVANLAETRTGALEGKTVATLFFEDSTRTKTSFALAARRMSAEVVDLPMGTSSVNKGETLIDTARTVEAMGVSAMVVRARQSGAAALIAGAVKCPVFNAGDGKHEHPTQGLLDAFTIAEAHGRLEDFDLSGLTVAIVGDVVSSRVARSGIAAITALGGKVVCAGPPSMAPGSLAALGCTVMHDMDSVVGAADVVMMLRIQFERQDAAKTGEKAEGSKQVVVSVHEYREVYGLTRERAGRMKKGAVVMHPGPMNRGIEIDGEVADGERSVVLRQVANGVAVRMEAARGRSRLWGLRG